MSKDAQSWLAQNLKLFHISNQYRRMYHSFFRTVPQDTGPQRQHFQPPWWKCILPLSLNVFSRSWVLRHPWSRKGSVVSLWRIFGHISMTGIEGAHILAIWTYVADSGNILSFTASDSWRCAKRLCLKIAHDAFMDDDSRSYFLPTDISLPFKSRQGWTGQLKALLHGLGLKLAYAATFL